MSDERTQARRAAEAVNAMAADWRSKGIHVGIGAADVRCVTCGEPWPCPASRGSGR